MNDNGYQELFEFFLMHDLKTVFRKGEVISQKYFDLKPLTETADQEICKKIKCSCEDWVDANMVDVYPEDYLKQRVDISIAYNNKCDKDIIIVEGYHFKFQIKLVQTGNGMAAELKHVRKFEAA